MATARITHPQPPTLAGTVAKFEEHPNLKCHVFQTVPDAPAEAVRHSADLLLYTSRELMSCLTAGCKPDDATMSYAAEFLADAAQAGYRSLVGEP
jgi:hypothetical protein